MASTAPRRFAAVLTAVSAALVIVAVSVVPFLSPQWVAFEQGRAEAAAWTGFDEPELRFATDAVLVDLVTGGDFQIDMSGSGDMLFNAREAAHMVDVQGVFALFALLAIVAAVGLVVLYVGARRLGHPERWWSAVRSGALGLIVGVVIAGVVAFFAFDAAFEVFHRLFFAGGSYLFDPATDRLVQLFPFAFWSETTMVLGVAIVALAAAVAFVAGRRARRVHPAAAPEPATTPATRPGSEPVA